MLISYNIIFTTIGLFIGGLFLSFYYGFKYASTHEFIRIAKIGINETDKEIKDKDVEEIEVISINSDKNKNETICILSCKYKDYAEQIDNILNNKTEK